MTPAIPTVYVESNFLVELVLEQEESAACQEILGLARAAQCTLAIPLYALIEPWETLRRRQAEMSSFAQDIEKKLRELERMAKVGVPAGTHKTLGKQVRNALNNWRPRLEGQRRDIMEVARILPLDVDTLIAAQDLVSSDVIEREPDAIMMASVMRDLSRAASSSLFINRNSRDFGPDARQLLLLHRCRLLGTFNDGLARLRAGSDSDVTDPTPAR